MLATQTNCLCKQIVAQKSATPQKEGAANDRHTQITTNNKCDKIAAACCNNNGQIDGTLIRRNTECGRESVIVFADN